jgi:RNA polymerase sigma factor (sigma-70 family)
MKFLTQDSLALFEPRQLPGSRQAANADNEFADHNYTDDWFNEQLAFQELLNWLAPDLEEAGRQYEAIRQKLITLFTFRRCRFPDELADETINRVTRKLPHIKSSYIGSPARYFYAVARRVYLESQRQVPIQKIFPVPSIKEDLEELFQCLDYALSQLGPTDRNLVLSYYQEDGQSKIKHRKTLAKQIGVDINTLRVRIYRIRSQLKSYFTVQE